jgi:solute carrier family 25 carnitine/acylcarnitine transporter 20/29
MAQPMLDSNVKTLKYPSIRSCIRHVLAVDGIRGFYKGYVPALLRSFPTNGAALLVFDSAMKILDGPK